MLAEVFDSDPMLLHASLSLGVGLSQGRPYWAALYQIQMTCDSASTVLKQFCESQVTDRADVDYFKTLLTDIAAQETKLLETIEPLLDRPLQEIDPVERAILLVGTYEMMHRLEVPFRVVINEGVELAKEFGASDSYRYINSILDGLAKHRETGK